METTKTDDRFVLGEFYCPLCQFELHSMKLRASDGAVAVNTDI